MCCIVYAYVCILINAVYDHMWLCTEYYGGLHTIEFFGPINSLQSVFMIHTNMFMSYICSQKCSLELIVVAFLIMCKVSVGKFCYVEKYLNLFYIYRHRECLNGGLQQRMLLR